MIVGKYGECCNSDNIYDLICESQSPTYKVLKFMPFNENSG